MLKLTLPALILISSLANAKNLTAQEIRDRLEVRADIYIVDGNGERIISGPERTNYWRVSPEKGTIEGEWSSKFESGLIALKHKWLVKNDGSIQATIEEFANASEKPEDPVLKNALEKKEFNIQNLEPVVWKVKNVKDHRYIVRYIPSLREVSTPISLDSLPIAGTGISISDNAGYLWAEDVQFNGRYSGVTSHRGTLVLSYVPFAGAKEMGFAEGNQITLSVDRKYQINLKAATSFLPAGVTAKVYAFYNPEKKSKGFNSLQTFDSSKEDRIQEAIKK